MSWVVRSRYMLSWHMSDSNGSGKPFWAYKWMNKVAELVSNIQDGVPILSKGCWTYLICSLLLKSCCLFVTSTMNHMFVAQSCTLQTMLLWLLVHYPRSIIVKVFIFSGRKCQQTNNFLVTILIIRQILLFYPRTERTPIHAPPPANWSWNQAIS